MNPVPKGAIEALGDTVAPGLPEAAGSEDSAPHAETKITAPMKSVALEPPRLTMFRSTVGGFIALSAPNEKVRPNDTCSAAASAQPAADRMRTTGHRVDGRLPVS